MGNSNCCPKPEYFYRICNAEVNNDVIHQPESSILLSDTHITKNPNYRKCKEFINFKEFRDEIIGIVQGYSTDAVDIMECSTKVYCMFHMLLFRMHNHLPQPV